MNAKLFELRAKKTFIPLLAIRPEARTEQEAYLLQESGYGNRDNHRQYVFLTRLDLEDRKVTCDPYAWITHDMREAHLYLERKFDFLESGAVIDIEFLAGKTPAPKEPQRLESPS